MRPGLYWQSRYSALIAMAESSVNLLILLAGVMVPIVHPGDLAGDTTVNAGISGYNVVNFLLTGEWRLRDIVLIFKKPMATEAHGKHGKHGIFTDNFCDLPWIPWLFITIST